MFTEPIDQWKDELSRLVGYACDGVLTLEQQIRLNEILAQGSAARSYYLRCISIHSALTTTAGNQSSRGVEVLRNRLMVGDEFKDRAPRGRDVATIFDSPFLRAAAILLLLVPPTYLIGSWIGSNGNMNTDVVVHPVTMSSPSQVRSPVESSLAVSQGKARVRRVAVETRWSHPNESYTVDSVIRSGSHLRFLEGDIELVYESGVKLLLMGPVDFVVQDSGGKLHRGGLMASVPRAGHGFTIETPNGKIVDLGTEFGVIVDDFGVSEVSVFEGKVEAFPSSESSPQNGKIRLAKGSALQWNSEMVKSLDADPRRLPVTLASYTKPDFEQLATEIAISDDFRTELVDAQQWMSLGDIQTSRGGLVLGSDTGSSEVPYLVTREQYDPTLGPITIICDIRFPRLTSADVPSFAILTRSASDRTAMDRPWRDILSTCVRCNFRSAVDEVDGVLETSTKYERDRELTSLSWRGFRRPQQDVPYRLVMRDDGVNVSFTVTQVDKPSITKTVICRSLFQGYANHIGLEGWDQGAIIVENLQVYQEPADVHLANQFARFAFASGSNGVASSTTRSNPLRGKITEDAVIVVEDEFDSHLLDTDTWSVLGEVSVENGAASLGGADVGEHIDTFHPRPYLLTRRKFNPADAKLYVLGKIRFDDNFLQGYGGSFAIVSRCEDRYGEGPEWAVSALSTGVRCNLWPAAPQSDHNLEIHEKPTPTTLTFLKGSSLAVNPRSRSYFFLMEDTGERVSITFQDADDPTIVGAIHHQTGPEAPRSGFIGFESTWGSRVLLDEVQIYAVRSDADKE